MREEASDGYRIHTLLLEEGRFLAFLRRRLGSSDFCEDILQSAYLRSLEKVGQVHAEENTVAWFYTLLRHTIADHFRSSPDRANSSEALEFLEAPEDAELRRSSEDCVRVAMRVMRPDDAQLVECMDLNGMEVAEAAERLGIPSKLVSQRLFRARQSLREHLQELCKSCTATKCLYCKCPGKETP